MAFSNLDGNVTDQNGVPVPGALVYVYDQPGGLADLQDSLGQLASNPITTDEDGYWSAYAEDDRYYTLKYSWGGRIRYVEANVLLGESVLGIQTDPNLRTDVTTDTAGKGADMVPYRGRTVKSKLDDWRTPLDMGIANVGVGNATQDTLALDAVMSDGKHLVIPKSLDLMTNTKTAHMYSSDRQIIELNGSVTHSGSLATIVSVYHGFLGIFGAFEKEGIQLIGGGRLNGAWDGVREEDAGRVGAGLVLSNCPQAYICGPQFEDFFEDGIKAFDAPEITVQRPTRFYHIRNIGIELRSYADNPYAVLGAPAGALGGAWTNTPYGPSGLIDGTFEWIDDGQQGAGNGTGVDFSSHEDAPAINNLRIRGSFLDCLLGIWSENNPPAPNAYDIDIDALVQGNIRGLNADPTLTAECSDAVGLVGVRGARVKLRVKDQTNIAPPVSGAETVGLNIIQCTDIEADVRITTDTGIANRMQHAVKLSASTGVSLTGSQSGVTGISTKAPSISTPILFDTAFVEAADRALIENYDVQIDAFQGGNAASTWILNYGGGKADCSLPGGLVAFRFTLANVPASATTSLLTLGGNGFTKEVLLSHGRLVGVTAEASAALTGTLTIAASVSGVAQPLVQLAETDFSGTPPIAAKHADGALCEQSAPKGTLEVKATTNGAWTSTTDLEVTAWFDPRWKA